MCIRDRLKADVLLVPHHGSRFSSSAAFLDAVQPRTALVQAGYRNRFGHPAAPVLVRYEERHIQVIDSPHCGAAVSYTHLRAHETRHDLVCRLLLEKKKTHLI